MGFALSADRVSALLKLTRELAHVREPAELRSAIGRTVLDLFEADYFASYEFNEDTGLFESGVNLNMDPANLARYDGYYQQHDPITFKLQARKRATAVVEVMPQDELTRTEFFNDFLHKDGLWWGMNFYAYDGARNIGDMRIWRSRKLGNFDRRDLMLLDEVGRAFTSALIGARAQSAARPASRLDPRHVAERFALTEREAEVAVLIARGFRDAQIGDELGISIATVRTHLGRVIDKTGVPSRGGLAACLLT